MYNKNAQKYDLMKLSLFISHLSKLYYANSFITFLSYERVRFRKLIANKLLNVNLFKHRYEPLIHYRPFQILVQGCLIFIFL